MSKQAILDSVSEMYDRSKELIDSGDNEKLMGRMFTLGEKMKGDDADATLEIAVLTKLMFLEMKNE